MSVDQKDGTCSCESTQERAKLNKQLAQMLKGGVIMDVTTPEQARIAEAAGAAAVMALERIPADIRKAGGVSRMSDPKMIKGIQEAVCIPVMAKCRIGHFVGSADPRSDRDRLHRRIVKCSRRLTMPTTSTSTQFKRCPSSAARATWVRRFAASPRAPP